MQTELIFEARDIVGESLIWDADRLRLVWVDIVGRRIQTIDPESRQYESWATPDFVTSIGLRRDGGAIVGLTKTVCLWDFGGSFRPLVSIEPDLPGNRLNEGVVGPDGAFWVGTMQNNIAPDGSPTDITADTGRIWRCTADGAVTALSEDRFGITNTFCWTNGGGLVTADTLQNALYRYAIDPVTHQFSDRHIYLQGFDRGLPDGSTMDAEGYIWNCRVAGGGCVVRIDPEGRIDRVIDLPCSWPTSCAFGGPGLDTLFVTSARFSMTADHIAGHPQEGGLFAVKTGVTGVPCHRFG